MALLLTSTLVRRRLRLATRLASLTGTMRVELLGTARNESVVAALRNAFPAFVLLGELETPELGTPDVDEDAWRSATFNFWAFDRAADARRDEGAALRILARSEEPTMFVRSVLLRLQRLAPMRNAASTVPWFDALLEAHRELHDLSKPLVQADYDHARDAWQWALRLAPDASAAAQAATLLHDIERLETEAVQRIEHLAPDYRAFKEAHARAGAAIAGAVLARAGAEAETLERTCQLIAHHESPGPSTDAALVNEADALSFFSLNSPGYVDYFGAEQGRRKVAYTLARLSPRGRALLDGLHLRPDVAALLRAVEKDASWSPRQA